MAKKDQNKNVERFEGGDQVDYILKLLESLPQQAQAKAFEELKNRLSINQNKKTEASKSSDENDPSISTGVASSLGKPNNKRRTAVATVTKERARTRVVEDASTSNVNISSASTSNVNILSASTSNENIPPTSTSNANITAFTSDLHKFIPEPDEKTNYEAILPHSPLQNNSVENESTSPVSVENEILEFQQTSNDPRLRKRKLSTPRRIVTIERPITTNNILDDKIVKGCFVSLQKLNLLDPVINVFEIKTPRKRKKKKFDDFVMDKVSSIIEVDNNEDYQFGTAKNPKKLRDPNKAKNYCEICNIQYQSYNGYINHRFMHTGESPHICNYCGKRFALKHTMDVHVRRHENDKPFKCGLCDYRSVAKVEVLKHMAVHDAAKKNYICEACGKAFVNQSRLNTHMKTVHASDNIECELCGYFAKSKFYLERHNTACHTDQEVFECPICNKIIQQKVVFKAHLEKHTGLTPFGCEKCGKKFPNKSRLGLHIKTHDEAIIPCDFCDKKFKTVTHLRRHAIIHTTDKPFSCHICGYSCNVNGNLVKHVRLVHQVQDFKVKKELGKSSNDTEVYDAENKLLLEKGLNILEEVLKKSSVIAGKEFTIEELKEMEEQQEGIRAEKNKKNYRIFNCEKRRRGRPKKPVLLDPNAARLAEEAKLRKLNSSNDKDGSSSQSKENAIKVDLNQYVFEVEEDEVEVPIEADEEGKRLKMYIIEVASDDERDNSSSEVKSAPEKKVPEQIVIDETSIIKVAETTDLTSKN